MSRRRIAQAATVIMLGNLVTSVLGYVRQFVTARQFSGCGAHTDAWFAAYTVPQMFYDLAIGGAIAAALIPSFTILSEENREQYWRVVSTIFVIVAVVTVALIAVLELAAPLVMRLIASGFIQPATHSDCGSPLDLSIELVRVVLPTLFFWGLSAVSLAALYAIGKRVVSSFATACFHIGIIVSAILLGTQMGLGVVALPIGAVAGAGVQFLVQVPTLLRERRRAGKLAGPWIDFHDPAVLRIIKIYAPVAVGIVVSLAGQVADLELKSHLGKNGHYSDMQYATTVIQFPVGIVVAALSLAVLPLISMDAAADRINEYKEKIGLGFRVVLVLMIPAAVGIMLLSGPIGRLLFEHGQLAPGQAHQIGLALLGYAPQLPFIGIDQILIFAFYARRNTVTPMLVGILGVATYVVAGVLLGYVFDLRVLGLAMANTIQITVHALVLLILLVRAVGWIRNRQVLTTIGKVALATMAMAAVIIVVSTAVGSANAGRLHALWQVAAPIAVAAAIYPGALYLLRLDELHVIRAAVLERIGRG